MRRTCALLIVLAAFAAAAAPPEAAPDAKTLQKMTARFAPTRLEVDLSRLSGGDRKALAKLVEAARVVDDIYLTQLWSGSQALHAKLKADTTPSGRLALRYFWINKSPWSALDEDRAFLPGVPPKKLPGANFYPEDMSKEEMEAWKATLGEPARKDAEGFFSVIRRGPDRKLGAVPYSREYHDRLVRAAALLKEAAASTSNASLKRFLALRADAFLSDDYYASDVAWMDLDAPVDVTIGPYETYDDELFGYKASFEAFVNVRDDKETAKLDVFAKHLQEIEDNLPIDPKLRNPKIGALAPMRVVNQVFVAGSRGVQTAAYNLPNDERVVREKGSKRVMLKNVQEAKFTKTLVPISKKVLAPAARVDLSFDAFFTHILAHELTHGLGPHTIARPSGDTTPRKELKDLYGAIEEAKADVTGLFALQLLMDRKVAGLPSGPAAERRLYTTFLASAFRTLRFGPNDAHGRGMAVQFNALLDRGGFVAAPDGTFSVDFSKIKDAVRALDGELLSLEAAGDYAGARKMLDTLGQVRPELKRALDALSDIPTDIEPILVTAESVAH